MRKFIILPIFLLLCSCSNYSNENFDNEIEESTYEQVAEQYVSNLIYRSNLKNNRSIEEGNLYPSFLESLSVKNENNDVISFKDMSEEEKNILFETWKNFKTETLISKFEENPDLYNSIKTENKAFDDTINSRSAKINDLESFEKLYFKNLEKYIKKDSQNNRSAINSGNVTGAQLNQDSINLFIQNNKNYNVLYCSDGVGHTSLMYKNNININQSDSNVLSTFSSFPTEYNITWNNMTDGTQLEPIGLWCGTASGSENKITIYKVMGVHFVEKKIKINSYEPNAPKEVIVMEPVYTEPTLEQYNAVGKAIENYLLKPIPYVPNEKGKKLVYVANYIKYKSSNQYSYCSQIVWKCWKVNGAEFDMDSDLPWISPSDIASSYNTVKIQSYKNK